MMGLLSLALIPTAATAQTRQMTIKYLRAYKTQEGKGKVDAIRVKYKVDNGKWRQLKKNMRAGDKWNINKTIIYSRKVQFKVVEWDASIFNKDETLGETTVYASTLTPGGVKKYPLTKHKSDYILALEGGRIVDDSPPQNPSSSTREFTVRLVAQGLPGTGPQPFVGRFPTSGNLPAGNLVKMTVVRTVGPTLAVRFVKAGFSTRDCEKPNATVMLTSGQSTTADQMKQIFGTSQPRLPVQIAACVGTSNGQPVSQVFVRVTYTKD